MVVVGFKIFYQARVKNKVLIRTIVGTISLVGLLLIYLFQRADIAGYFGAHDKSVNFIVNRTLRFCANDVCAIGLIYALFVEKKYVVFSVFVQAAGIFLILIPYFILKIHYVNYNGPLISYLHRLILNPVLTLALIPAFYYQRLQNRNK